jgi:ABC-type Fe3+-siderophore transport system permease subunit
MGKKRLFSFIDVNITNTIIGVLFITGALLVGFSREKREDEFIAGIRLSSLLWAVAVNYLLLLLAFIFIYGTPFLDVMLYNMFTVLILFIARFHYMLYKNSKPLTDEK